MPPARKWLPVRDVLFVAGEASGDLHAAGVARELRGRNAPYRLVGIGGDAMRDAGVELIEHVEGLAVMGFVEVLRHVPKHWALLRDLKRRIRSGNTALLILIDYPGFNMKLAAAASAAGVPVLYYITPQVWAWGAGRLAKLAQTVTRAAVILPFEEKLLSEHGVPTTFVGHPLLDRAERLPTRAEARAQLGVPDDASLLALFPGSRAQEIARHLEPFVATARELERRRPGLRVVVSAAPHIRLDESACPYPIVRSASFSVLRAADAAMCKSGTTTLEAAVAECPLVVAYRTNALTYAAARRLVKIPNIGLVNVVAGREVAPEFVQNALQPNAVADALEPLLDHESTKRARMVTGLARVRDSLGTPGAARRVASIAIELAGGGAGLVAGAGIGATG
ncbi:MAG TPA: lipid-A-disaccharide synthase [Gemmatimonadaceae bacterium]|nr:lipid-A-disaccharide synthase [Gemmatimonadaceae bacterium]